MAICGVVLISMYIKNGDYANASFFKRANTL